MASRFSQLIQLLFPQNVFLLTICKQEFDRSVKLNVSLVKTPRLLPENDLKYKKDTDKRSVSLEMM